MNFFSVRNYNYKFYGKSIEVQDNTNAYLVYLFAAYMNDNSRRCIVV